MKLVGLEKEYFLVDNETFTFVFPDENKYPLDDFKFLVELRGKPSTSAKEAINTLTLEEAKYAEIAKSDNLTLLSQPYFITHTPFINSFMNKHNFYSIPPNTYNIYDINETMHYGIKHIDNNKSILIAGLHIHYSDDKTFPPLQSIAMYNDSIIENFIKQNHRTPGELENKIYPNNQKGGEYRSCPNNIPHHILSRLLNAYLNNEV